MSVNRRINVRQTALVLGPYGRPPDLIRFGVVLLVVEDIGIARVFSLIQELVLASEQHRAMVRKLIVVWQMEDLGTWLSQQPRARCLSLNIGDCANGVQTIVVG